MNQIEHVVLRRDVVVKLAHRHSACLCEVPGRRRVKAFLEKDFTRARDDSLMLILDELRILRRR